MNAVLLLVTVVSVAVLTYAGPVDVVESASLAAIKEAQKGALDAITLGVKSTQKILGKADAHSDLAKAAKEIQYNLRWAYFDAAELFSYVILKHQSTFKNLKG